MCSLCDETVELLKQTGQAGGSAHYNYVSFSFPGGKPELKTVHSNTIVCPCEAGTCTHPPGDCCIHRKNRTDAR